MPKFPKFSELTDISGLVAKVKSAIDNLTGPADSVAAEEALAHEKDPLKLRLLEIELLVGQLNDINLIQNKAVNDLRVKCHEMKVMLADILDKKEERKEEKSEEEN